MLQHEFRFEENVKIDSQQLRVSYIVCRLSYGWMEYSWRQQLLLLDISLCNDSIDIPAITNVHRTHHDGLMNNNNTQSKLPEIFATQLRCMWRQLAKMCRVSWEMEDGRRRSSHKSEAIAWPGIFEGRRQWGSGPVVSREHLVLSLAYGHLSIIFNEILHTHWLTICTRIRYQNIVRSSSSVCRIHLNRQIRVIPSICQIVNNQLCDFDFSLKSHLTIPDATQPPLHDKPC